MTTTTTSARTVRDRVAAAILLDGPNPPSLPVLLLAASELARRTDNPDVVARLSEAFPNISTVAQALPTDVERLLYAARLGGGL